MRVKYSTQSIEDRNELFDFITYQCDSPITAFRYLQGIKDAINKIAKNPEAYPIRYNPSLSQYGPFVRRVNYKKMAIIYTANDKFVYIHRIIPESMITGL